MTVERDVTAELGAAESHAAGGPADAGRPDDHGGGGRAGPPLSAAAPAGNPPSQPRSGAGAPAAGSPPSQRRPGAARGPALFARFAYPPNCLGLCGPDDHAALLQAAGETGAAAEAELRHLAHGFAGAWPYLQLIAAANRIADPLDDRVVAAYWIGNRLLDAVPARWLADQAADRFRRIAGTRFDRVAAAVLLGGRPHHNFHVFAVYPWTGLLRGDRTGQPLRVLDRCRIRAGTVQAVAPQTVTVATTTLRWDGHRLGEHPHIERLIWQRDGHRLGGAPAAGDWVALHWDWVCQPITGQQAAELSAWTQRHLQIANRLQGGAAPAPSLQ